MKDIPYFEPPVSLEPLPMESINCPVQPMLTLEPMTNPIEAEIKRFGKYWDDNFHWDLVSRQVAEVSMQMEDPTANSTRKLEIWKEAQELEIKNILQDRIGDEMEELIRKTQSGELDNTVAEVKRKIDDPYAPSRKEFQIWQEALKSDIGEILQERIGDDVKRFIRWAQRVEWDNIIVANLEESRKKDKVYDAKMAFLTHYNEEIDIEEKIRRLNTLMPNVAKNAIYTALAIDATKWPQSWHLDDKNLLTDEEWDSEVENFPKAMEAIQGIPEIHLHRRKLAAPAYWTQQREAWRQGYEK
jgi:hypothetical protein